MNSATRLPSLRCTCLLPALAALTLACASEDETARRSLTVTLTTPSQVRSSAYIDGVEETAEVLVKAQEADGTPGAGVLTLVSSAGTLDSARRHALLELQNGEARATLSCPLTDADCAAGLVRVRASWLERSASRTLYVGPVGQERAEGTYVPAAPGSSGVMAPLLVGLSGGATPVRIWASVKTPTVLQGIIPENTLVLCVSASNRPIWSSTNTLGIPEPDGFSATSPQANDTIFRAECGAGVLDCKETPVGLLYTCKDPLIGAWRNRAGADVVQNLKGSPGLVADTGVQSLAYDYSTHQLSVVGRSGTSYPAGSLAVSSGYDPRRTSRVEGTGFIVVNPTLPNELRHISATGENTLRATYAPWPPEFFNRRDFSLAGDGTLYALGEYRGLPGTFLASLRPDGSPPDVTEVLTCPEGSTDVGCFSGVRLEGR